jgi:hypothetical protein
MVAVAGSRAPGRRAVTLDPTDRWPQASSRRLKPNQSTWSGISVQDGFTWHHGLADLGNEDTDDALGRRAQEHFGGPCVDDIPGRFRRCNGCVCQGALFRSRPELCFRIARLRDSDVRFAADNLRLRDISILQRDIRSRGENRLAQIPASPGLALTALEDLALQCLDPFDPDTRKDPVAIGFRLIHLRAPSTAAQSSGLLNIARVRRVGLSVPASPWIGTSVSGLPYGSKRPGANRCRVASPGAVIGVPACAARQRRVTEVNVAVHVLNRMLEPGRPSYDRII